MTERTVEVSVESLYELQKSAERELTVRPRDEWEGNSRSSLQEALHEAHTVRREFYRVNE